MLRIKCDGRVPCRECLAHGQVCSRGVSSGRVSVLASNRSDTSTSENFMDDQLFSPGVGGCSRTTHCAEGLPSEASNQGSDWQSSAGVQSTGSYDHNVAESRAPVEKDGLEYVVGVCNTQGMSSVGTAEHGSPIHDTSAWPWLHEDLYLQGAPALQALLDPSGQELVGVGPGVTSATQDSAIPLSSNFGDLPAVDDRLDDVVDELVAYAAASASDPQPLVDRRQQWQSAAHRIRSSGTYVDYHHAQQVAHSVHALQAYVDMYMRLFNPLWPLVSLDGFDANDLHPVLYLTLTSIGAMYGNATDQQYGTLMHERLRRLLTAGLFDLEGHSDDLSWLLLSRLLVQVAALYFGQRRAFSYAQVCEPTASAVQHLTSRLASWRYSDSAGTPNGYVPRATLEEFSER